MSGYGILREKTPRNNRRKKSFKSGYKFTQKRLLFHHLVERKHLPIKFLKLKILIFASFYSFYRTK